MDEQRIFGPLTLRQFFYVAAGLGLILYIYNNFEQGISIPLIFIIAVATFILVRNARPEPFNESYIQKKLSFLNPDQFKKWQQKAIAMIQAQISVREEKGLPADPELIKIKGILESVFDKRK